MIKGNYQVRKNDGTLIPVQAWEFELLGIGPLIVHRDVQYPNTWTTSDPMSGSFLYRNEATRKGAIQKVTNRVHVEEGWNRDDFDDWQARWLRKYADSPTDYYKQKQQEEREAGGDSRLRNEVE